VIEIRSPMDSPLVLLCLGPFKRAVNRRAFRSCRNANQSQPEFALRTWGTEEDLDLVARAIHEGANSVAITAGNKVRVAAMAEELGFAALADRAKAASDGPCADASAAEITRLEAQLAALRGQVLGQLPSLDCAILAIPPHFLFRIHASRFDLLYRGSRDGFDARAFHGRCDGRRRTLTVVETARHAVFGGFAAVAWHSDGGSTADPSGTSFLFAVRGPRGEPGDAPPRGPPRVFSLRDSRSDHAIIGRADCGPVFGGGADLFIADNCNLEPFSSCAFFGWSYANDTGTEGWWYLAGEPAFSVHEIEVFEAVP
jgi:hypothetical protein